MHQIPTDLRIYDETETGHINTVLPKIISNIDKILQHPSVNAFMIGTTDYPYERFSHYISEFDNRETLLIPDIMIVLYRTSSLSYCRDVESVLIHHYRQHQCIINSEGAGKGKIGHDPPYYLYMIVEFTEDGANSFKSWIKSNYSF
jgi:hypothetical protein